LPEARLDPSDAVEIRNGPIRIFSQRAVCWEIKAWKSGYHLLHFHIAEPAVSGGPSTFSADKELAIGNGFMRVSAERPGWCWTDI
jgi:hypothetical protein